MNYLTEAMIAIETGDAAEAIGRIEPLADELQAIVTALGGRPQSSAVIEATTHARTALDAIDRCVTSLKDEQR